MVFDLIVAAVLVLSLAALLVILFRKFPTLAAVNASPEVERLQERKSRLMEERLKRKFVHWWSHVGVVSTPVAKRTRAWWETAHAKLVDLEHEYKIRSLPVFLSRHQRGKVDREIARLLAEAQAFVADNEIAAAEEKALQTVRLEPRSVPAFEFLADLYVRRKEYGHAKEVYRYLLKLLTEAKPIFQHHELAGGAQTAVDADQTNARYLLGLAQVCRELGDWPLAFASIQEARRNEPNNPKLLDEDIEICIGYQKRQFAADALAKIREVNPDNSKIADWEQRIAAVESVSLVTPEQDAEATEPPPESTD